MIVSCGGTDDAVDSSLRENVVEPGIEALDTGSDLACSTDASQMRTALESYELLIGSPAPDEDALVTEGFLRQPSEFWDVVDGGLVAEHPACSDTPTDVPEIEIETTDEGPVTADDFFDNLPPEAIDEVGGEACARELAEIFAAGERYLVERNEPPADLAALVDGDYLEPPALWSFAEGDLVPIEGSGCRVASAGSADPADSDG